MDQVRLEADDRQYGEHRLGKIGKPFEIPDGIAGIAGRTAEIVFIVDEVELNPLVFHLHDADIAVLIAQIHIEMGHVLHLVLPLLLHTGILRKDHANVKIILVKAFWQGSCNIRQATGLDERNRLRSSIHDFLHPITLL